jgi:Zinc-binding dehydrogenase
MRVNAMKAIAIQNSFGLASLQVVDRVFPFIDAREALQYLESGVHFGKICLQF